AVGGLEQAGGTATAPHLPGGTIYLPDGGIDHLGVVGVQDQVGSPSLVTLIKDLFPRLSAVGGLEDPALLVGAERMAQYGCIDDVGIGGMYPHPRDRLRFLEAGVGPGLSCINGLIYPVALHDVSAELRFPHSDIDDVGIAVGHVDRAHRGGVDLPVGDGIPAEAAVGGLPESAPGGAKIVFVDPVGMAGDGGGAPAPVGSCNAVFKGLEQGGVGSHLLCPKFLLGP